MTPPSGPFLTSQCLQEDISLVFASGKDRSIAGEELHTNFSLSAGGEYLALTGNDGITPLSFFSPEYPEQAYGLSYGTGSRD